MATLKEQKAAPNSVYWRKKADKAWADDVKEVGECEICHKEGKIRKEDGKPFKGLHAHHLILRGNLRHRFDLSNGLCLCVACHGAHPHYRNNKRCAHGSDEAKKALMEWFEEERPGQFEWYEEHKEDKRQMEGTYRDKYEELTKG